MRSTTIRVRPDSSASPRAAFSSGAVNRSISPATATTWRASSIGSLVRVNSGGIGLVRLTDRTAERRAPCSAAEVQAEDELASVPVRHRAGLHVVGDAIEDVPDARQVAVGQQLLRRRRGAARPRAARGARRRRPPRRRRGRCGRAPGAWAATASVSRMASSRRSIGHCARAASIPTTRPSTAPTSGPLRMRTTASLAVLPSLMQTLRRRWRARRGRRSSAPRSPRERPVPSSSDSASVAMSGSPSPSPGLSGRGTMPRPRSVTTSDRRRSSIEARSPIGPSPSG